MSSAVFNPYYVWTCKFFRVESIKPQAHLSILTMSGRVSFPVLSLIKPQAHLSIRTMSGRVSFPVLNLFKPQAPLLVMPFRQFL